MPNLHKFAQEVVLPLHRGYTFRNKNSRSRSRTINALLSSCWDTSYQVFWAQEKRNLAWRHCRCCVSPKRGVWKWMLPDLSPQRPGTHVGKVCCSRLLWIWAAVAPVQICAGCRPAWLKLGGLKYTASRLCCPGSIVCSLMIFAQS